MTTAEKVYTMLGNENLWLAATYCHQVLADAEIPHSVCGGVAVCLHGYQRNTTEVDLIIERGRVNDVRQIFESTGFQCDGTVDEYLTADGIAVKFLLTGDRAGKDSEVRLPSPAGELNVETIEGLPVLSLSRLIEIKIACGAQNIRRMHKDFADVVELFAIRKLDGTFAKYLHKSVRHVYRKLVQNAQGES